MVAAANSLNIIKIGLVESEAGSIQARRSKYEIRECYGQFRAVYSLNEL